MTLFPSAFRIDRPRALRAPARSDHVLANLVKHLLIRRRPSATTGLSVVAADADTTHHPRPEPRLKWTDTHTTPAGDFAASAVSHAELPTVGVPRRGSSWDAVADFALSYDGYGYWDDLPELARRVLQHWTRSRSLPGTLDELRGCLFYEQRRWHHFGEDPTGRSAQYMWAIVDAIAALVAPFRSTVMPVSDPRPTAVLGAHVRLVEARTGSVHRVPLRAVTLRPVPTSVGRLVPVAAAETHVRLVATIEEEASAVSRHPSGHDSRRPPTHSPEHPSMTGAIRDLRPMPTAEPLPKPPVIVRRSRPASGAPNRPGGAVHATRSAKDAHPSNGARWNPEIVLGLSTPAAAEVTPLCHEFCRDDAGYLAWVDSHPDGFVLNRPRAARSKPPTLHRIGCAAVARRDGGEALTAGAVKVCGPSADALEAWSMSRGTGQPTACRRCHP